MIITIKSADQFYASYGEAWANIAFPMNPWDSGGHTYAVIPSRLLGKKIEIDDDEYDFLIKNGVLRYFNPGNAVMEFITPEMVVGLYKKDGKIVPPTIIKPYDPLTDTEEPTIYKDLYKIFMKDIMHVCASPIIELDECIIEDKINCYFD